MSYFLLASSSSASGTSELELVSMIAGLVIALATIARFIYRTLRRVEEAIGADDQGRSLNERHTELDRRTSRIEHQLWPNGGSSLADKVSRQEINLVVMSEQMQQVSTLLNAVFSYPPAVSPELLALLRDSKEDQNPAA